MKLMLVVNWIIIIEIYSLKKKKFNTPIKNYSLKNNQLDLLMYFNLKLNKKKQQ